jgi:hypothetical protein
VADFPLAVFGCVTFPLASRSGMPPELTDEDDRRLGHLTSTIDRSHDRCGRSFEGRMGTLQENESPGPPIKSIISIRHFQALGLANYAEC